MNHYVCTGGCDGQSSTPGICQAEGCKKEGEPLVECSCTDGMHEHANHKHELGEEENETE